MFESNSFKASFKVGLAYCFSIYAALFLAETVCGMLSLKLKDPLSAIIFGTTIILSLITGKALALKLNDQGDQINKTSLINDVKLVLIVAAATMFGYTLGYQFIGKEYGGANMAVGFLFGLLQFAVLTSKKPKAATEVK
jgi:hypothetical protein